MMTIDEVLESLDQMIDKAWSMPFSGKCMIDADKVRDMIDEIRLTLPGEIKQAKAIVADRAQIITDAKRESDMIISKAQAQAKVLVANEEITKQATAQANEMMQTAAQRSKEVKQSAREFVDKVMKTSEETLSNAHSQIQQTRQTFLRNFK